MTSLPGLPTEIIRHLGNFLDEYEEALLVLTCKQLLHILGTKSWWNLNPSSHKRKMFMHFLERDLSDHYANSDHLTRKLPDSLLTTFEKGSGAHYSTERGCLINRERFGYAVAYPHVVFALKANIFGAQHGISLDAFGHEADRSSLFKINMA